MESACTPALLHGIVSRGDPAGFMGQGGLPDKVGLTPIFERFYRDESRRFVLWLPVLLGIGIGIYFGLEAEPAPAWGWLFVLPFALIEIGRASCRERVGIAVGGVG